MLCSMPWGGQWCGHQLHVYPHSSYQLRLIHGDDDNDDDDDDRVLQGTGFVVL